MTPSRWWLALAASSAGLLALDYVTGPYILFPITFVVPVGFAAWYLGRAAGVGFAVALSGLRVAHVLSEGGPLADPAVELVNGVVRTAVLVGLAVLLDRVARTQARLRATEERLTARNAALGAQVSERTLALAGTEQRFQAIFHTQFQFIGLMAPSGELLEANRTALAAAGVAEADVLGRPFWETAWWAHDAAQQDRLRAAVRRAAGGEQDRFEASHPAADGSLIWVDFSLTPCRDPAGAVAFLIPEGRDITDRKRIEAELREKTTVLGAILDSMGDAVLVTDRGGRILLRNRAFRALHEGPPVPGPVDGWARAFGVYLPGGERLCPADQLPIVRAIRGEPTDDVELEVVSPEHPAGVAVSVTGRPLAGPDGVAGGVIVIRDVSARVRAEVALRDGRERLAVALDNAGHGLWDWDIAAGTLYLDDNWKAVYGYAPDELPSEYRSWEERIHPDDKPRVLDALARHLASADAPYDVDYRALRKDGAWAWVNTRGRVSGRAADGRPDRMIGTVHDVTARKRAEEVVLAALREKETLLKEVHHRVKNNLAVIGSLFYLQSGYTHDAATLRVLQDCQDRVRSMALVHERLYRSGDFTRVNFGEYAAELADHLVRNYALAPGAVRLAVRADEVFLDIDRAIPCGLVLNELIANALKHAFPDGRAGEVRVELTQGPADGVVLTVADDGVGLPDEPTLQARSSLGLRLVRSLARQLDATVEFARRDPGTEVHLRLGESP